MRKRVLEPLGMRQTVTSVTEAQLREHAEAYGRPANETGNRAVIPWREADQIAPAGQMIACATDIAQWLKLQLSDGEIAGTGNGSGPRRVISAASLAMTKQIHTPVNSPGPDPDMYFYGYGCGWMIGAYRGRRLVWHNGGIDGFKTDIALLPDDGIAVAASCNVLETSLPFALAFHIVDALLGEPPKPWSDTLMSAEGSSPAPESPEAVPSTQPSHSLLAYAGTYRHPGYGTVSVEVQGGELRVCLGELEVVSRYRHYDTWTVTYEPLDSHWPLTFLTDADGRIHAAEIPLEPSIKPIRFEAVAKETDV
ncbi:MAG: serine hydrolase [Chloroflexota bacterium]